MRFFWGFALITYLLSAACGQTPMLGVDCNYTLEMADHHKGWTDTTKAIDSFSFFAAHGCRQVRIRLWVGDEGTNRLNYATETAKRAQAAGMQPYLVIFLSENWADFVKQPAPKAWQGLSLEDKCQAVQKHAQQVTRHMIDSGLKIETFEIGNEIDFGICGEFEEQWPRRVSLDYMRQNIWPREAKIIQAAEAGVRSACRSPRFVIHLSQWDHADYCIEMWSTLTKAGVQIDYPGLSYFPSSSKNAQERSFDYLKSQVAKINNAMHKPVLICETGYPAAPNFGGQFADWNHPAENYPLTDAGQAKWTRDLLQMVKSDDHFVGLFYWSPEWYAGGIWDAFAWFDANGTARPVAKAFDP